MRGLPLPLCYLALLFGSAELLLQLGSAHPGGHPAGSIFDTVLVELADRQSVAGLDPIFLRWGGGGSLSPSDLGASWV